MSRKKFAVVMIVLLGVAAIAVWIGLDYVAGYVGQMEEPAAADPAAATAATSKLMRIVAIANGVVLSAFALLIVWHGRRGLRSESMPPTGSWILQGQRTWSGKPAVRIAKFTIAVGVILGVLGIASSSVLWSLGESVMDRAAKGTYTR